MAKENTKKEGKLVGTCNQKCENWCLLCCLLFSKWLHENSSCTKEIWFDTVHGKTNLFSVNKAVILHTKINKTKRFESPEYLPMEIHPTHDNLMAFSSCGW